MREHFLLLAVNAKYIHTSLAVYDLAAFARERGQDIETAEYTINEDEGKILEGVLEKAPDGIFFACYLWNISLIGHLLPRIHAALPECALYLGGPEVSYRPEKLLAEFPYLSGIIAGEGEASLTELLAFWPSRGSMGRVIRAQMLLPLDEIPFPYDRGFLESAGENGKILYYETSRGCPFSCSYCLSSRREGVRLRSLPLVRHELQAFMDAGVPLVKFVDRTFNISHEHALGIWEYLAEHDNGITGFHFEIGADLLTETELSVLRKMRPGRIQFEIGVQTTNEETIRAVSRSMDLAALKAAVADLHQARRIPIHLDLIAGLPYEGYASFGKSFDDVYAMQPDQLQLGFLKVLSGTEMEKDAAAYGIHFQEEAPYTVTETPWLSAGELARLHRIARLVDVYHNSHQFTESLPYLIGKKGSAFAFFEALADYYETHGCPYVTPSRLLRYEILRDFSQDGGELTERLSVDLYLRERLRHRPEWVHDLDGRMTFDYGHRDPMTGNAEVRMKAADGMTETAAEEMKRFSGTEEIS